MNDVREFVMNTLCLLGFGKAKSLGEQLVCLDNSYVGVRFTFEGVSAIWLNDASIVRFVDDAGKVLKVVRFTRSQDVTKKAA
jgi:hypothetical protein